MTVLTVPVDGVGLEGDLKVPGDAEGLVVFSHGSGSSRHSPRNNYVAEQLRERGLGTLLFDLLTEEEDRDRSNRFDIPLLTDRLVGVMDWLDAGEDTGELDLGLFGSSTGAASALRAAAMRDVGAVVSRGGRVDLAEDAFNAVGVPTLLIVGGNDREVLELNRQALDVLSEAELHVVEGAGHLFEEEGALEEVAGVAGDWFQRHLGG